MARTPGGVFEGSATVSEHIHGTGVSEGGCRNEHLPFKFRRWAEPFVFFRAPSVLVLYSDVGDPCCDCVTGLGFKPHEETACDSDCATKEGFYRAMDAMSTWVPSQHRACFAVL